MMVCGREKSQMTLSKGVHTPHTREQKGHAERFLCLLVGGDLRVATCGMPSRSQEHQTSVKVEASAAPAAVRLAAAREIQ